jgi:hypothetical protein
MDQLGCEDWHDAFGSAHAERHPNDVAATAREEGKAMSETTIDEYLALIKANPLPPLTPDQRREAARQLRKRAANLQEAKPNPSIFDTELRVDLIREAQDLERQAALLDMVRAQ